MNGYKKNCGNTHILGYYSVIKRNKLLIYATICVDLSDIVQSERAGTKYNTEFYENLEMENLMCSDGKHISGCVGPEVG